jgi:ComF family protein
MSGVLNTALAMLFPQRTVCHACGAPLSGGEGFLCAPCRQALLACALLPVRLALPLRESVELAAAAFAYRSTAAALVKTLKFGADHTAALPLAEGMAGIFAEMRELRAAEVCVAVPTHARRLRRRGYNQADVLARAFSEMTGVPMLADALVRVHHRRSQIGQGREARRRNVAGAFAVNEGCAQRICGKRILLIDDVLTTGATVEECARTLVAAGAHSVAVLAAAYAL